MTTKLNKLDKAAKYAKENPELVKGKDVLQVLEIMEQVENPKTETTKEAIDKLTPEQKEQANQSIKRMDNAINDIREKSANLKAIQETSKKTLPSKVDNSGFIVGTKDSPNSICLQGNGLTVFHKSKQGYLCQTFLKFTDLKDMKHISFANELSDEALQMIYKIQRNLNGISI